METTIRMHRDAFVKISQEAEYRNISRSALIAALIQKFMDKSGGGERLGKQVCYQDRKTKGEWRTVHVYFREDMYEFCLDLRKFYKMSVSLILALSINEFLDDRLNTKPDNYRFRNYIIVKEVIDTLICWRLYWGYTPQVVKSLKT